MADANSADPHHTAPEAAVSSESALFAIQLKKQNLNQKLYEVFRALGHLP